MGIEFKYPPEYSLPVDSGAQVVTISQSDKNTSFDFQRESVAGHDCMAGLCNVAAQNQITTNSIVWDFVGQANYGEGGNMPNQVYRTVHGSCRYYVTFTKETRIQEILSSVSFLTADASCTDIKG